MVKLNTCINTNNDQNIICCSPQKATPTIARVFESQYSMNMNINRLHSKNIITNTYTPPPERLCFEKNIPQRPSSAPTSTQTIDIHDVYRELSQKKERKLSKFFGDNPPFDISVKEIEANGLKALLQSKVPICYFLYSLLEDFCCENLFFYLEAIQFEKAKYENKEEQQKAAVNIFNTYFSRTSVIEINIDEKIRSEISKFIKNLKPNTSESAVSKCFKGARNAILQLMEGSFVKFQKSKAYKRMKLDLGSCQIYSEKEKLAATSILKEYMDFRTSKLVQSLKQDPTNKLTITNIKRQRVISILTHEFSKSMLNMDFDDDEIIMDSKNVFIGASRIKIN